MQDVPVAPEVSIAEPSVRTRDAVSAVRWSEWVIIAFLVYAAAAGEILPVASPVGSLVVLLNSAVILSYALIIRCDFAKRTLAIGIIRDWLPLGMILLAYREMGWFALPHYGHALEARWVMWDGAFLHGGATAAIEAFGSVLPSALEICYSLVYALAPFSLAILYLYRRRDRVDRLLFIFALGVLLCYAQFPLWPSEPPRAVFFGEDFPAYDTVFRRFNWWMLGNYGIHTSCFPSAHVAAAFSAAFGMRQALPERQWVSRVLLTMAFLIALATVYGRYHYGADAAAGFAVAVFAVAVDMGLREIGRRAPANAAASPSASAGMPVEALGDFGPVVKAGRCVSIGFAHSAIGATRALSSSGNSELTQ
jgi:membrane-associated phospholipid phosphatase